MYSWQFSKNFPLPQNGSHFEFLPKMEKHKIASISLTVRDRAISSKFSTHRVSKKCSVANFQKIFPFPKMVAILNFRIFATNGKNTKLLLSPKPCEIERFRRNIRPTEYLRNVLLQFSKNFPLPKNGGLFEFLPKMAKHKIASISLTVRDRAISSKFSTHRVSKECTLGNFQKIFPSPKIGAILNFRIFAKNGKTQNCFYLLNRAR